MAPDSAAGYPGQRKTTMDSTDMLMYSYIIAYFHYVSLLYKVNVFLFFHSTVL